jgi:DNA-binding GntR family transcriptional regulator
MNNDETRQNLVAAHIRQAIMSGRLQPGERLIEQTLAAELHMSRGPVRDALRQLEQEGLVQIYRNRGAVVSTLDLRAAYEFYLVRGHLEGLAVRLAADHMRADDIACLQSVVDQMAELRGTDEDWLVAADLDVSFHRRIVHCSQNQSLIQTYGAMDVKINALFMTVKKYFAYRFATLPERHQKVVDVFRAGDWWRAESTVSDHWFETAAYFKHVLATTEPPNGDGTHERD